MTHAADPPSVMDLHDAYLRSAVVCNDAIKVRPYTHTLVWPMVIEAKNLAVINGIQGQEVPARNALAARPAIFALKAHQASRHKRVSVQSIEAGHGHSEGRAEEDYFGPRIPTENSTDSLHDSFVHQSGLTKCTLV